MVIDSSKDIEAVSNIASEFLNEPPVKVTPIIGKGSVNKVFVVAAGDNKIVVRMSERAQAPDEYAKEAWCIERAAALGVPVPAVLAVGRRDGYAYIVESYVAGDEGSDSRAAESYIWRELGGYARLIHSIEVAGLGLKLSDMTRGDARASWLQYLEYNIESLNEDDQLIKLNVLTHSQSKSIKRIFADLRAREFVFGLNHGDISLRNTIVDGRGVVSLLDWGSAEASIVPHHDLIQLLKMNMLENDPDLAALGAFLDGYGISQTEFGRMLPELESLLLLRAFDKLRWAIDWNVGELDEFVGHARDAVRRCLPRI
ncbi:MAG TPA: aminoglycoside phosphotransferase family protein [Pyrinomonadaceae bacterium]|nr:aminoglycoside phosphotransferase family protein [Pyrinomonadaceae bacterium]